MVKPKPSAPLRSLRILLVLSVVIPLLLYAGLGTFRYLESKDSAELTVSRSLRVSHEHALKVFGGAEALQDRLFDLVNGKSLPELRQAQQALHEVLRARVKGEAQLQSAWIIGSDGRPIASSNFYPVPDIDYSDRPYFGFHKATPAGRYLSEPFTSRTTGHRVADVSIGFRGPEGAFGGTINLSLHTSYFERFYSDVVSDEPGLAINLFHEGGAIFTRFPVLAHAPERIGAHSPIMVPLARGETAGQVRGVSSVDGQDRLLAFRKVGAYPLYVGTGVNVTSVRARLLKELGIVMALSLPLFIALYLASSTALRRTREAVDSAARLEAETLTRRRAEEALLQAQKLEALGRLTGGVAHDFNNALMVVSNNTYLLKGNVTQAGAKQLASIARAVDSATKLTRQLLAFSRRQPLLPERVDLVERLPAIQELISPVMGSQIRLVIGVAEDVHPILVDFAELELALLNLSINARDAMGSGGVFTIDAKNAGGEVPSEIKGDAVVIEARDTGSGIDPGVVDKVFEPFFTTKPPGLGTGLGLSQVYGLCQRAGGAVRIASEVGAGTTVSLFFPALAPSPSAVNEPQPPLNRSLGKVVLVVEDNNEVAGALLEVLGALGCQATRVVGAHAALEWLQARHAAPDLVLTDVMMPGGMDGMELARTLRHTSPDLPVLLMTGYAQRIEAINELGFEVLPKPCSPETLSAAIARVAR